MTKEELNYIKDAFSQIIDDIAGNPDWYEAARAVASDLGTLERKLEEKVASLPSNLDEAAEEYENNLGYYECINQWPSVGFKAGAEWMAGQGFLRWRNIDEEKPKRGEDCACISVTVDGHIIYSNFEEGPWYWNDKINNEWFGTEAFIGHNDYGDEEYHTCSHWMPWDEFMGLLERQFQKYTL